MTARTLISADRTTIGLDVGGTKIAAGVVRGDGRVVEQLRVASPRDDDGAHTMAVILGAVEQLRANHPEVEAIGVGAAGMVEWPSGRIRWAPNNTYRDLPVREVLISSTGLPAVVENDANAAAAAEAYLGRGLGHTDVVTITVGTGIGGGIVLGGELFRGATGLGAEVGHIIVDPAGGVPCGCGAVGCLEAMASGIALARMGQEAARRHPGSILATLVGSPEDVRGEVVFAAAQQQDPVAIDLFQTVGRWLGVGIATLVNVIEPHVVILAGGISHAAGELLLSATRSTFARFAFAGTRRQLPDIALARFGADAGVIGAAILANREFSRVKPGTCAAVT